MDNCGTGLLYEKVNLPQSFGSNASKFTFEKFRYMCILSGCDYLPSLPGIGLVKACKFFMLTCNTDIKSVSCFYIYFYFCQLFVIMIMYNQGSVQRKIGILLPFNKI